MAYFLSFIAQDWRSFKAQVISAEAKEKLKLFVKECAEKEGEKIREEHEKEIGTLWLDLGGVISLNSAKIEFNIGTVRFGVLVCQLPALFQCLSVTLEEFEPLAGYITFKGLHDVYSLIPIEMQNEMLLILQKLTTEYADKIREETVKMENVLTDIERQTDAIKHKTTYIFSSSNKKLQDCCGILTKNN